MNPNDPAITTTTTPSPVAPIQMPNSQPVAPSMITNEPIPTMPPSMPTLQQTGHADAATITSVSPDPNSTHIGSNAVSYSPPPPPPAVVQGVSPQTQAPLPGVSVQMQSTPQMQNLSSVTENPPEMHGTDSPVVAGHVKSEPSDYKQSVLVPPSVEPLKNDPVQASAPVVSAPVMPKTGSVNSDPSLITQDPIQQMPGGLSTATSNMSVTQPVQVQDAPHDVQSLETPGNVEQTTPQPQAPVFQEPSPISPIVQTVQNK